MRLLENTLYQEDLGKVTGLELEWDRLRGRLFMISGATGMIGSTLIDVLMKLNRERDLGVRILALGRSGEKARERFAEYWDCAEFSFCECDILDRGSVSNIKLCGASGASYGVSVSSHGTPGAACNMNGTPGTVDYVLHAAGNTHPVAYANDPIGTITANIIGLNNLLCFAAEHGCRRFLFASSNEIYGENRGDTELFDEQYCGYIDCNTLRAGYPESKRAGEALCQAYIRQKNLDAMVLRFTRSFGPRLLKTDTKALSQFLKNALGGEDIVLKSAGEQFYSYTYVCDAVSGLLTCLLRGKCGEAYNIADESCDITLRDLAKMIADYAGRKVVFEIPGEIEAAGFSKATKARLDGAKLRALGWRPQFDLEAGIRHTMEILRACAD